MEQEKLNKRWKHVAAGWTKAGAALASVDLPSFPVLSLSLHALAVQTRTIGLLLKLNEDQE